MREVALAHQVGADLLRSCEVLIDKPPLYEPSLAVLPERRVLRFPIEPIEADALSPESLLDTWTLRLREVRKEIESRGWPVCLCRCAGTTVKVDDLAERAVRFSEVVLDVTPKLGADVFECAETVPACAGLVEYTQGCDGDGRDHGVKERVLCLLDQCEAMGMEPSGDLMIEVVSELPVVTEALDHSIARLSLPVQVKNQHSWRVPSQHSLVTSWRSAT